MRPTLFLQELDRWQSFFVRSKQDFQRAIGPLLKEKVFILGSAPGPIRPADFSADWSLVCVNASQKSCRALSLPQPDLLYIRGNIFSEKIEDVEARAAITNESAGRVLIQRPDNSRVDLAQKLAALPYVSSQFDALPRWVKDRAVLDAVGNFGRFLQVRNAITAGVAAVALCHCLGARQIVLGGYSFTVAGHAYSSSQVQRRNVRNDSLALRFMLDAGLALFTTGPEFAEESGLPVWTGSLQA
ncbi:hypothetical protein [Devosia sp.]|uniref:hypothetical protein n=1 Tax=Devosia sp. TaxID=1871048 RepID=UPI001AD28A4A|nr:hypothetical protein [Devosia sp.]MBN9307901.1 hypothetical protein [Devosia sp.]